MCQKLPVFFTYQTQGYSARNRQGYFKYLLKCSSKNGINESVEKLLSHGKYHYLLRPLKWSVAGLYELLSSPVHLTSVNLRTDPFSVVLWGFLLRFGRNGVNFNIKITSSYGNGFDRTFNFTFLTPRHSAEFIVDRAF